MSTFADFRLATQAAYETGAKTTNREASAQLAIADFVKARISRLIDSDLVLAKSHSNSYFEAKIRLAGYTIVGTFATTKAAVQTLLGSADANRSAISTLIDALIQQAMDDINGTVTLFDSLLLDGLIEIQRHVRCAQESHETYYTAGELAVSGDVSIGLLPTGAQPMGFGYMRYAPTLAEGVAYLADDTVLSNGRIYTVATGGTIGVGLLGAGLISTDDEATETIDGVVFAFANNCDVREMTPTSWSNRSLLSEVTHNESYVGQLLYGIDPTSTKFFVYPKIESTYQLRLEWAGVKTSFVGTDTVLFGKTEASAVAEYIRGMLYREVAQDDQSAKSSLGMFQALLRRLVIDCSARKAGA